MSTTINVHAHEAQADRAEARELSRTARQRRLRAVRTLARRDLAAARLARRAQA